MHPVTHDDYTHVLIHLILKIGFTESLIYIHLYVKYGILINEVLRFVTVESTTIYKLNFSLYLTFPRTNMIKTSYCSYGRPAQPCLIRWLGMLQSDSVIKLVLVLFGKCTTLVVTKCSPMEIRLPCGDQWKAEKLGAFWRWPITRCYIQSDRAWLIIGHSMNFRLNGEHWRAVQFPYLGGSTKIVVYGLEVSEKRY